MATIELWNQVGFLPSGLHQESLIYYELLVTQITYTEEHGLLYFWVVLRVRAY